MYGYEKNKNGWYLIGDYEDFFLLIWDEINSVMWGCVLCY